MFLISLLGARAVSDDYVAQANSPDMIRQIEEMSDEATLGVSGAGSCTNNGCGSDSCGRNACAGNACGGNSCIGNVCGGDVCGVNGCIGNACLPAGCVADGCLGNLFDQDQSIGGSSA